MKQAAGKFEKSHTVSPNNAPLKNGYVIRTYNAGKKLTLMTPNVFQRVIKKHSL